MSSVAGLKAALVARPERFATTIAERLLTYALGRGLEPYDAPRVRGIVAQAAEDGYRMQSLIVAVAQSYPFVTRRSEPPSRVSSASAAGTGHAVDPVHGTALSSASAVHP